LLMVELCWTKRRKLAKRKNTYASTSQKKPSTSPKQPHLFFPSRQTIAPLPPPPLRNRLKGALRFR
jgi:hypothetical protein